MLKMTKEELKLLEILKDNRQIAKKGKEATHEESDEEYDGQRLIELIGAN